MSVELDPPELGFRRPFTHEVSQVLRLHNPHRDPIAFKVKTTAPKQYCVRPNSGRIEPNNSVEVQVLLQSMKEDPPLDAKCRDKFLVQSVAIDADSEHSNVHEVWQYIEKTAKSTIQEKKIRVFFLPEDGAAINGNGNGNEDTSFASSAVSPSPIQAHTPRTSQYNDSKSEHVSSPPPYENGAASSNGTTVDRGASLGTGFTDIMRGSSVAGVTAGIASVVPTSSDELQQKLDEAMATISRLREQVQEQGLRQRKTDTVNQDSKERLSTGTTGMGVQKPSSSGVPVQIVAGLCLLCFLIAYLFF